MSYLETSFSDAMLRRAAQLARTYPQTKNVKVDEDTLFSAAISQVIVESAKTQALAQLDINLRYGLIQKMQLAILESNPAPAHAPYQPIDERPIADKIRAIAKVSKTLRLSDTYTDFILNISQKAALDFAEQTSYLKSLLKKHHNPDKHTKYVRDFHERYMGHFQNGLRAISVHDSFINAAKPASIIQYLINPTTSPDGKITSCIGGFASTFITMEPSTFCIFVNPHPEAMLSNAEDATELAAHESGHIPEGFLGFMFGHHAEFIPKELKEDAAIIHAMHANQGYISPRLNSLYPDQANERVAFASGKTARAVITLALDILRREQSPTHPALS